MVSIRSIARKGLEVTHVKTPSWCYKDWVRVCLETARNITHAKVSEKYAVIQPPAVTKMLPDALERSQTITPLVAAHNQTESIERANMHIPHRASSMIIGKATMV